MNKIERFNPEALNEELDGKQNPFTVNWTFPVTEIPVKGKAALNEEGEKVPYTFMVEKTPCARLYKTTENKQNIYSLSNKALWLFTYIVLNIEPGKDYIQINAEHYKKKLGVSADNTFLNARLELIDKCFIATTRYKSVFWINPEVFFPGSRVHKYPENRDVTRYRAPNKPKNDDPA